MATEQDLLPCPFCGKIPDGGLWKGSIGIWHTGECRIAGIAFSREQWNTRSTSSDYERGRREGIEDAALLAKKEFWRSPEVAKDHDSIYMGGYEDACDHLSVEILTLHKSTTPQLEWAAQWIIDSLKGETNERVIEFGKNIAMTFRALLPVEKSSPPVPEKE
jgi:hypothetical protein